MLDRIQRRNGMRTAISQWADESMGLRKDMSPLFQTEALLLISQSFDDYIEYRITADKTIEGILKDIQMSGRDIQANLGRIADKTEND